MQGSEKESKTVFETISDYFFVYKPGSKEKIIAEYFFEDKPDWIGKSIADVLKANPTLALTLLYVAISGLGMVYEMLLFGRFGIDILEYSEAGDFFLGSFKRVESFSTAFGLILSLVMYRYIAQWGRRRKNKVLKFLVCFIAWVGLLRREILVPLGIFYFVYFFVYSAEFEADKIKSGYKTDVAVIHTRHDKSTIELVPIGSTESFFFGFRTTKSTISGRLPESDSSSYKIIFRSYGIPFSNINRIEYKAIEEDYTA